MEGIQLVLDHLVDVVLDDLLGKKVPAAIEHEAAPGEPGIIGNLHGRRHPSSPAGGVAFDLRREEPDKRLRSIEQTRCRGGADVNARAGHIQLIAFAILHGSEAEDDGVTPVGVSAGFRDPQTETSGRGQPGVQKIGDVPRIRRAGGDQDDRIGAELERTGAEFRRDRLGNEAEGRRGGGSGSRGENSDRKNSSMHG